jgi:hypothetical protein
MAPSHYSALNLDSSFSDKFFLKETLSKGVPPPQRKLFGMTDMFILFIVVMVSWMYIYVKTFQIIILNMCHLFYDNNTLIKLLNKSSPYNHNFLSDFISLGEIIYLK